MESARDLAEQMQREGKGIILDQFANPDNPQAHYERHGPRNLARYRGHDHAFRVQHGHHRHHHGRVALSEGKEPGHPDRRLRSPTRARRSRAYASGRKPICRRSSTEPRRPGRNVSQADAEDMARRMASRGRHFRRHFVRWRLRRRAAHRAAGRERRPSSSSSATAATAICRPACFPPESD